MTHQKLRATALALLLGLAALGAVMARAVIEGELEMQSSDEAFNRGDVRVAANHARRAAVLYAPGAPHVRAAHERLTAIAVGSEALGDSVTARLAWRALRGAVLEVRHVWTPFSSQLAESNRRLARLAVLELPPSADRQAAERRSLARLESLDTPAVGWMVALLAGFCASALGVAWMVLRGVDGEGRGLRAEGRLAACVSLLGVLCWLLAAYHA